MIDSLEDRIKQEVERLNIKASGYRHEAEMLNKVANEIESQSENLRFLLENYKDDMAENS